VSVLETALGIELGTQANAVGKELSAYDTLNTPLQPSQYPLLASLTS
jgi:hypothetical protein